MLTENTATIRGKPITFSWTGFDDPCTLWHFKLYIPDLVRNDVDFISLPEKFFHTLRSLECIGNFVLINSSK